MAEGITDLVVLRALVTDWLGAAVDCIPLQPQQSPFGDYGPDGSGWRGVRGWCQSDGRRAETIDLGLVDALVVHLDADVAGRSDFVTLAGSLEQPCPPAEDTTDALRCLLGTWMDVAARYDVVLAMPSKATDTWILVAHFPNWTDHIRHIECEPDPAGRMVSRPFKLLPTKDGKPKKRRRDYEGFALEVARQWPTVAEVCPAAKRFEDDVRRLLSPT